MNRSAAWHSNLYAKHDREGAYDLYSAFFVLVFVPFSGLVLGLQQSSCSLGRYILREQVLKSIQHAGHKKEFCFTFKVHTLSPWPSNMPGRRIAIQWSRGQKVRAARGAWGWRISAEINYAAALGRREVCGPCAGRGQRGEARFRLQVRVRGDDCCSRHTVPGSFPHICSSNPLVSWPRSGRCSMATLSLGGTVRFVG